MRLARRRRRRRRGRRGGGKAGGDPASHRRLEPPPPGRQIAIVTTAALPWMTGTSINPLLRAAYLSKAGYDIIVVPWLRQQKGLSFRAGPDGPLTFAKPREQEQYIRWWLENRGNIEAPDLHPLVPGPLVPAAGLHHPGHRRHHADRSAERARRCHPRRARAPQLVPPRPAVDRRVSARRRYRAHQLPAVRAAEHEGESSRAVSLRRDSPRS